MGKNDAPAPFALPDDLAGLSAEDLAGLQTSARAELDAIFGTEGGATADQLPRAQEIDKALDALDTEANKRAEQAAETKAQFDAIQAKRTAQAETEAAPAAEPVLEGEVVEPAAAPELATVASGGARTAPREFGGLSGESAPRINPSLSAARNAAPRQPAPVERLALTASMSSAGGEVEAGQIIPDLKSLAELYEQAARSLPVIASARRPGQPYGGRNVARLRHNYATKFDMTSPRDAVFAYADELTRRQSPSAMAALTAAGGWCAPSQIRYDFFNVVCSGGRIDLPTFGVERGGLRWPISPSVIDAFTPDLGYFEAAFSEGTVPWLWTETTDAQAATGTVTKPCIRVPCSTMDEARLECYGVCVTAGNLADDAWPESTANFLKFLDGVFGHAINSRYIAAIRALTTDIGTVSATGLGVASPILDTVEMAAWDYRKRLGMCATDVLEVIFPDWTVGAIRQDIGRRTGLAEFNVTDAMIMTWFDVRGVRVQFVDNYQSRTTGLPGASSAITSWPSTVEFMIYSPGTFGLGNGMTLDLGVVRDSTLNAKNDHTAAWYEQCHLIAKFGHLARRYTVQICGNGTTGSANITSCLP